jgi:hypothetical protein
MTKRKVVEDAQWRGSLGMKVARSAFHGILRQAQADSFRFLWLHRRLVEQLSCIIVEAREEAILIERTFEETRCTLLE